MKESRGRILIIDDDAEMRALMMDYLKQSEYEVHDFELATQAFEFLVNGKKDLIANPLPDLIVSDIQMPEMDGFEFVERCKKLIPEVPVILMTAFASIESAIEATRIGAYDYIVKPFKLSEFSHRVAKGVERRRLQKENEVLRKEISRNWSYNEMIGKSKGMQEVFDLVDRVAKASANILITGESGTGKEMVAAAIHQQGPRAEKPFVAINCTAIPENLLESELFGHAKGAFTGAIARKKGLFEEADGGTIFLDEIGDMDMALQAKLLRVLQERRIKAVGDNAWKDIDVRIIAATHKDLNEAVRDGRFREDLYYRLSVIPVMIPALRHRREDIPLLAQHFLEKYAAANASPVKGFSPEAIDEMVKMKWPGNVRELENVIERLVVLVNKPLVEPSDLPHFEKQSADEFYGSVISDLPTMEQLEKRYIGYVLQKTGGRKEKAAQILGINRRTLYRKERDYNLLDESGKLRVSAPLSDKVNRVPSSS